jgi:diguanylate cyclase (GGDEF)-like protein
MPVSTRDEPHPTPFDSLSRNTQEFSLHTAELDAAMRLDRARIQRQAILRQRTTRIIASLALAIAAVSRDRTPSTLLAVVAIVVLYLGVVGVIAAAVTRASPDRGHDTSAAFLIAADVAMISTLFARAGGAGTAHDILLLGVLLVAMATFSFGRRFGSLAAGLVGLGYLAAVAWHGGSPQPDSLAVALDTVIFGATSIVLIRALGGFRHRMDALRMYCKLGELGETAAPIPVDTTREPDDLTLLARSFDSMRSRLAEQIGSDPLTACANRRTLEKRLLADWRFARRRASCVAVTAIDIDHFKQINDTRGHPVGDLVLQQLASIMMSTARDTDTVARLGGDEFVIVLPDTDWHGATTFAERLRSRVMEYTFGSPGAPLAITISVGVAIGDGAASITPETLLGDADRSLYRAKTEGRNRVSA